MKINLVVDTDKKDLFEQYNWAINRLDEIINTPPSNDLQRTTAIVDEAKISRKVIVLMKKILSQKI